MTHSQRGTVSAPVIIGGIIILLLLSSGYYISQRKSVPTGGDVMMEDGEELMEEANEDVMLEEDDETIMEEDEVREMVPGDSSYSGQVLAGSSAPLLVFNQADYDKAVSEGKLVVLYFYANWCPTCKAEFPLAEAAFDQLTTSEVVGFRVNFNDNETSAEETALAREFGVPYQHTKVFVRMGEQVLKSPEEWTTQRYVDEIMSHL